MNRLIKIFSKYYVLILFIVLQTLSVLIIFQGRNYHRSLMANSINDFTGETYASVNTIQSYFNLRSVNADLAKKNEDLLNQGEHAIQRVNAEYLTVDDSLYRQKYTFRKAEVVNSSVHKKNNFIVLNLGEKDGVTEEMGVVTSNGVLGMIVATSEHYSKAISFLHSDSRVSCKIKRTGSTGILYWGKIEIGKAQLLDLPLTTIVEVGDTIMTSGYSSVYPKGIELGVVSNTAKNQETQMLDIEVSLFEDFNALNYAFIVENLDKTELKEVLDAPTE